jgi:hypothetical protein
MLLAAVRLAFVIRAVARLTIASLPELSRSSRPEATMCTALCTQSYFAAERTSEAEMLSVSKPL